MLALGGVYVDELELDIQLAQRPEDANRTGRREPIELHGVAVSFGSKQTKKRRMPRRMTFLLIRGKRPRARRLRARPRQGGRGRSDDRPLRRPLACHVSTSRPGRAAAPATWA